MLGPQQLGGRRGHGLIKASMAGQRLIAAIHRVRTPLRSDNRRVRQQTLETVVIQRRRHNKELEIVAQPLLHVQQQRQSQIGLQATLVELIEDHQSNVGQLGIALDHAGQDPLGDHLQARRCADAGLTAHPVAHRLTGLLAQ